MVTALMLKSEHSTPLRSSTSHPSSFSLLLRRLSDENKDLRLQLRALNGQLDSLIQSASERHGPSDTVPKELETVTKVLPVYEVQHQKLTARVGQLQDGTYRTTLEKTVLEQETKVRELETSIANKRKYRKKRENVLESVLETGVTPEMAAALKDQQAQVVLASRKVAETEKRNAQIAETFRKLGEREEELTKEIAKIEASGIKIDPISPVKPLILPASPDKEAAIKRVENSLARKRVMVHSLEKQLQEEQDLLSACSLKLERLSSDLESKAAEMQNMSGMVEERVGHRRAWSNPSRKLGLTDR